MCSSASHAPKPHFLAALAPLHSSDPGRPLCRSELYIPGIRSRAEVQSPVQELGQSECAQA